jgi:hypothetical protein
MAHKPAGWCVCQQRDDGFAGEQVAGLSHYPSHGISVEANARLIAAAPELLEACQRLLDDFKLAIADLGFDEDEECAIAWAEEAIAKATGKDQS